MTSIVDAPTAAATPDDGGGRDAIETIYQRVQAEDARFLPTINGQQVYSQTALALFIHEVVTDHTATVVAELGTADEVRHVIDLLVGKLEENDRLREENDRLRAELHGREPVT